MTTEPKTKPARQVTVSLPPARVEQLRAIGAKLNLSVADVIGHMIAKEIAAGVIANEIPGIRVSREGAAILMSFGEAEPIRMTPDQAASVVHDIRARAQGSEIRQALYALVEGQVPDSRLTSLSVQRKGTGVNIRIRDQVKSFSPVLATELADLIEQAAA